MADLEISRLPQLAGADVQGTDPIAVADLSASETKKLSVADLLAGAPSYIPNGSISGDKIISINGSQIDADSITNRELAANSVTNIELADNAVDTPAIQDSAVTNDKVASGIDGSKLLDSSVSDSKIISLNGAKINDNTITANELAPNSVGSSELADNAVDTAAIQDGAVTDAKITGPIDGSKLASDSVTSTELAPNSVGSSELADNAVDTNAIQDSAVTNNKLTSGIDGSKLLDNSVDNDKIISLDGAKINNNTITANELAPGSVGSSELANDAVDTAAIQNGAVTNAKITGPIDGNKLAPDSVTSAELAPNSVGSSELADNAVDTLAIQDAAVTDDKLASGINGSKLINGSVDDSKISSLNGAKISDSTITSNELAPNSVGSSELAGNAVDTAAIQDGAVTDVKITGPINGGKLASGINGSKLTNGSIDDSKISSLNGAKISDNTITANKLAPNSVGSSELAGNAVDTAAIQDGAVTDVKITGPINGGKLASNSVTSNEIASGAVGTGELANGAVTDSKILGPINGSKLQTGTVSPAALGAVTDRGLNQSTGNIGIANSITPGAKSGITYDAQGLITGTTAIDPTELPVATETAIGAVSVPVNGGLAVTGAGAISISNTITPNTKSGIVYDEHGLITGTAAIDPADLPIATGTTPGVVNVPSGTGIEVDGTGALSHQPSGVIAGTYAKVTVNNRGHVTQGSGLSSTDIPSLDAGKINTGTFDAARIADRSLTNAKFANYSVTLIQEAEPSGTDHYVGQFWYRESDAQLRTWSGNSWIPVGFGRLSEENLRFSGTFDAQHHNVVQITPFGATAGLVPGAALPAATDTLTGVYLVVTEPGTYNGLTYDNGDWILCLGQAQGWQRVDTLTGGGTTTISLSDLLDVTVTTPASGDTLIFDGVTGKWINKPTAAQKATFAEAIDGIRTSFTLSRDAASANNLLISIGGIIQEPGADFTFTSPRTVDFITPPPAGIDYWVIIEGVASTGGGGGGTALPDGTAAEELLGWSATLGSWQPKNIIDGGSF